MSRTAIIALVVLLVGVLAGNVAVVVSRTGDQDAQAVAAPTDADDASDPADVGDEVDEPSPSPSPEPSPSPSPSAEGTDAPAGGAEDATDPAEPSDAPVAAAPPSPTAQPTQAPPPTDGGGSTPVPSPDATLGRPAAGTYTYAADGYQEVSVDGSRRDYPATVAAAVARSGADAWSLELDVPDSTRDRFDFERAGDELRWTRWEVERTFLGQTRVEVYQCAPAAYHVPDGASGRTAKVSCEGDASTLTGTLTQTDDVPVTLGDGTTVTATKLVIESVESGEAEGRGRIELWLEPETGMRLREVRDISSTQQTRFGPVEYREEVDLLLESLTAA